MASPPANVEVAEASDAMNSVAVSEPVVVSSASLRKNTSSMNALVIVEDELYAPAPSPKRKPVGVEEPVPPFATESIPVTASLSARSRAPHAYVSAAVTLSTCPTVDEFRAVNALVPLPCSMPVRVVAPLPPLFTARVPVVSDSATPKDDDAMSVHCVPS